MDRAFPMSDIAACTLLCVGSTEMLKLHFGPFSSCPLECHGAVWKRSCPFLFADRWRCRGLGLCGAGEQTLPHPGCGPQRASGRGWDEGGFSKWDDFPGKFLLLGEGLGLPAFGEGEVLFFPVCLCLSFRHLCTGSSVVFKPPPVSFLLSLRFLKSLFHMRLNYSFQVVLLTFFLFEVGFHSCGWLVLVVMVFLFFDGFFFKLQFFFQLCTILASLFTIYVTAGMHLLYFAFIETGKVRNT